MNPLWRKVALLLVALACAIGILVIAGIEDELAGSDPTATLR